MDNGDWVLGIENVVLGIEYRDSKADWRWKVKRDWESEILGIRY